MAGEHPDGEAVDGGGEGAEPVPLRFEHVPATHRQGAEGFAEAAGQLDVARRLARRTREQAARSDPEDTA